MKLMLWNRCIPELFVCTLEARVLAGFSEKGFLLPRQNSLDKMFREFFDFYRDGGKDGTGCEIYADGDGTRRAWKGMDGSKSGGRGGARQGGTYHWAGVS